MSIDIKIWNLGKSKKEAKAYVVGSRAYKLPNIDLYWAQGGPREPKWMWNARTVKKDVARPVALTAFCERDLLSLHIRILRDHEVDNDVDAPWKWFPRFERDAKRRPPFASKIVELIELSSIQGEVGSGATPNIIAVILWFVWSQPRSWSQAWR